MSLTHPTISAAQLLEAIYQGARAVIAEKKQLNDINVFPVADGDTGNNLSSLMHAILNVSLASREEISVQAVLDEISEASFMGARGNSGVIFAQYFNGLASHYRDKIKDSISLETLCQLFHHGAVSAFNALANPVEGTILTLMKGWADFLNHHQQFHQDGFQLLNEALDHTEQLLKKTKHQLKELKRNGVVDAGGCGFYLFVKGFTEAIIHKPTAPSLDDPAIVSFQASDHESSQYRYCTEVLVDEVWAEGAELRQLINDLGDSQVVAIHGTKAKVHIHTNNPSLVIERMLTHGKVIHHKVEDMHWQSHVKGHRLHDIALVTDSIADIPQSFLDHHHIGVFPMNVAIGDMHYLDRLTISAASLVAMSHDPNTKISSSLPAIKTIEDILSHVNQHYPNMIVLTVSSQLSGTFNLIQSIARSINPKIAVVDTKKNSVAQGLIVHRAMNSVLAGKPMAQVMAGIEKDIASTHIFVSVPSVQAMVQSGRISAKAGRIVAALNLKPIIGLSPQGKGSIRAIALSTQKAEEKIIQRIKALHKKKPIQQFALVHVNNRQQAEALSAKLELILGFAAEYIDEASAVIALSAGEGSVAVAINQAN